MDWLVACQGKSEGPCDLFHISNLGGENGPEGTQTQAPGQLKGPCDLIMGGGKARDCMREHGHLQIIYNY